jgi:capsular polysaccharide biosynthesis protein
MKKFSQKIFKIFFQYVFKLIYGKIFYNLDNLKSSKILIKEIKKKNISNYYGKCYRVYKIKNGRIYTDNLENVAVIDQNKIIDNISYQQILGNLVKANKNSSLKKGTPRIKRKFKGRVLSLAQGASGNSNYFHWLFDLLPKIKLYSEVYRLNELDYLYANKLNKFQFESLVALKLEKIKIIDIKKNRHIEADEIICTDHPYYLSGYFDIESQNIPNWIVKWLRATFLQKAKKFICSEKIFIDRSSSSNHYNFINNLELSNFLANNGFIKYKIENLSFFEQIYLFKNAKIIIGAHGAGLANLAFCKKEAKIIEIMPKNRNISLYQRISKINDLDYKLIKTNIIEKLNTINHNMYLDIEILKKYT